MQCLTRSETCFVLASSSLDAEAGAVRHSAKEMDMETVVIAVFEDQAHAQRARAHLLHAGLLTAAERSTSGRAPAAGAAGDTDLQVLATKFWTIETQAGNEDERQRALAILEAARTIDVEVRTLQDPAPVDAAPTGDEKSYPVGAGIGAAAGGLAAGALAGSVAGPLGTVLGVAAGAVAGGLAGKDFAQAVDPSAQRESGID
jgi:outer membrane lipoprotein SlyB